MVKNTLDFFKCLRDTTIQYKLTNKVRIEKIAFYTKMEIKLVEKLRSVTIWFVVFLIYKVVSTICTIGPLLKF